jgi:hypothetical protein
MKVKYGILCLILFAASVAISPAQTPAPAPANAAAPPSASPQASQADLEKLVAPIALYPDPLLATLLPASAYPLDIVKAARFLKDTNNIPKIDSQPWDPNVKALARFPDVLNKMNEDIDWTSDLGDAFVNNQKGVMTAIQTMRNKAHDVGNLKTTPQQVVTVTNDVVQQTVNNQVVVVTNTIVQIQPSNPSVVYVPSYSPTVVYAAPAPGAYVAASAMTFGVGMMWGAAVANSCNWHDCDVNVNHNYNRNVNVNNANGNSNNRNYGQNGSRNRANTTANQANRNGAGAQANRNGAGRSGGAYGAGNNGANGAGNFGGGNAGNQRWQADSSRRTANSGASQASRGYGSTGNAGRSDAFSNYGGGSQTRAASNRGTASRGGGSFGGGGGGFRAGGGGGRSGGGFRGGGGRGGGRR